MTESQEAILEGEPVAVGKIICVGRNYARHNEEMGERADAEPVFFLKPRTSFLSGHNLRVSVPLGFGELHHEVELAVLIGRRGRVLDAAEALEYVSGYAVAMDLTLRDIQFKAKSEGMPWDLPKGFDGAAPTGEFVNREAVTDPHNLVIELDVNGQLKQSSKTSLMVHRVGDLLAAVSAFMTLEPGDILLTGTPEGVGPLENGDRVVGRIEGLPELEVEIARPSGGIIEAHS